MLKNSKRCAYIVTQIIFRNGSDFVVFSLFILFYHVIIVYLVFIVLYHVAVDIYFKLRGFSSSKLK